MLVPVRRAFGNSTADEVPPHGRVWLVSWGSGGVYAPLTKPVPTSVGVSNAEFITLSTRSASALVVLTVTAGSGLDEVGDGGGESSAVGSAADVAGGPVSGVDDSGLDDRRFDDCAVEDPVVDSGADELTTDEPEEVEDVALDGVMDAAVGFP